MPIPGADSVSRTRSTLTPVSGAAQGDGGALCYLLELGKGAEGAGGVTLLLDCGWSDITKGRDRAEEMVNTLEEKQIDAVLLSGSSMVHLGALPYLVEQGVLDGCPIFATQAAKSMGHIALYDAYDTAVERTGSSPFSSDSIDKAMSMFRTLKFYEVLRYSPKGSSTFSAASPSDDIGDVFLSPTAAGVSLGTCIWHIVRDSDEVAYAPYFNHRAERHLPPADLQPLAKSSLCILSAKSVAVPVAPSDREAVLIDRVMSTLRRDGNVLIPVDTAGRVLEVLLVLERYWRETYGGGRAPYNLAVLSEYGECTVAMSEQALEFMSESIRQAFETSGSNPLSFISRGVAKFCRNRAELAELKGPTCCLAAPFSMDMGYSLDLMLEWCENKNNCVVLLEDGAPGSIASFLKPFAEGEGGGGVLLRVHQEVPLPEDELQAWREKEQARLDEELAAEEAARQSKNVRKIVDEAENLSDSDQEEEEAGEPQQADRPCSTPEPSEEAGSTPGLFLPQSLTYKSRHLMFPFIETHQAPNEKDDYGENVEDEISSKLRLSENVTEAVFRELALDEERERRKAEGEPVLPAAAYPSPATQGEGVRTVPRTVDDLPLPKKYEMRDVHIDVRCTVALIPYHGTADGATVKHVVASRCGQAQKLVFINGTAEQVAELSGFVRSGVIVKAPGLFSEVDVTPSTAIYRLVVSDSLINNFFPVDVSDYKVSAVEGIVVAPDTSALEEEPQAKRHKAVYPVFTVDPAAGAKRSGQPATFVGSITLRELSAQLRHAGWRTEFRRGSLLCNQQCAVRRADKGSLAVNGVFSPDWFRLRSAIASNFTVL